jgi:hypothetical protein
MDRGRADVRRRLLGIPDMIDPDKRIESLEQSMADLASAVSRLSSPLREVFIARRVTNHEWQELTIRDGEVQEFPGGRKCTAEGHASMLEIEEGDEVILEVEDRGAYRYVKIPRGTPAPRRFVARIVSSSQVAPKKRWQYEIEEMEKTAAGLETGGGWTLLDGGIHAGAWNLNESANGSTGLYGNGVDSASLLGTFDIQPIPDGTLIDVWTEFVDGDPEYWFNIPNGIDGDCGEG